MLIRGCFSYLYVLGSRISSFFIHLIIHLFNKDTQTSYLYYEKISQVGEITKISRKRGLLNKLWYNKEGKFYTGSNSVC
jgi:hypothetical protein